MLRWPPRWHHVSRLRSRKPFTPTRLESNSPKSRSTQESKFTSWIPVLYNAPFPAPLRWAIYSLVGITSSHIFVTYFYEFEPTYGISMLPTLASFGDWVFISKYYRRGRQVKAGDIVSFKHPVRIGERAIKRVLAMEGDFVLKNTPGKSEAMIQVKFGGKTSLEILLTSFVRCLKVTAGSLATICCTRVIPGCLDLCLWL